MILEINEKVRIKTDTYNYTVERWTVARSGKNAGKGDWIAQTYHSNLSQALLQVHSDNKKALGTVTLDNLLEGIQASEKAICEAVERYYRK